MATIVTYDHTEDEVVFPKKHPTAVREITVDMSTFLTSSRTVSSISVGGVSPSVGSFAVDSSSFNDDGFTLTVSAGAVKNRYKLEVTTTLSTSEIEVVVVVVPVAIPGEE